MRQRLLICGESTGSGASVSTRLAQSGFSVETVGDYEGAVRRSQADPRPVVVAPPSIQMGVDLCRALRWVTRSPVIAVLPEEADASPAGARVVEACLDAGADAVTSAALGRRELAARLAAALRRRRNYVSQPTNQDIYEFGQLVISESTHSATVAGERIALTPTEFRLLVALARRAGHVASHEELIADTWGRPADGGSRTLRLYVAYLRRKLGACRGRGPMIVNQRGIGYRLAEAVGSLNPERTA